MNNRETKKTPLFHARTFLVTEKSSFQLIFVRNCLVELVFMVNFIKFERIIFPAISFFKSWRNEVQQSELIKREALSLQYQVLQNQVNPHFLHNTLNVLFEQAMDCSEELADNILKLSKIMRYALEGAETKDDRVPVDRELEQLGLLIDFHRMRFDTTKLVRYTITGTASGQQVPPLSFITIVENAFKYGDLNDDAQPLTIHVVLREGFVQFTCCNKKRRDEVPASSHSIGIANLSKRLEASSTGQYSITVEEDDRFYTIVFTLQ